MLPRPAGTRLPELALKLAVAVTVAAGIALASGAAQAQAVTQLIDANGDGAGNTLHWAEDIAVDGAGNVYVTGRFSDNVFQIDPNGVITEIMNGRGDGAGNTLDLALEVAVDGSGNVYVTGGVSDNVFQIDLNGVVTEIIDASAGGEGPLDFPLAIAADGSGNVYIAGLGSDNAFRVEPNGTITKIIDASAGGAGTLNSPEGIAVDGSGNVYVAGAVSDNAFRIDSNGVVTEIIDASAGGAGTLNNPSGIAADGSGNVYVSGGLSDNAFQIDPNGVITEIIDASGDGLGNTLNLPNDIAAGASGNVYLAGGISDNVFLIDPNGVITEIMDASAGGAGTLDNPEGIAVDAWGNVYVAGSRGDNAFKIHLSCGNGALELGEECDDGNGEDGDGCSAHCLIESCGDGIVNNAPNEECDDGNNSDGDGCSADCQLEPLNKAQQNCVNSMNKGAAKVAKAQGGDNVACIKHGSKGKLTGTIEQCITSYPKSKVQKAISKIKTGDCPTPPAFPVIDTDAESIGQTMVQKELDLIHTIFGSDLDAVIADATASSEDKAAAKCQSAIAKAAAKCQDTKLKEFNACKKNALKVGKEPLPNGVFSAQELQDECMGTDGNRIPDTKVKIVKKCATGLSNTVSKKCAGLNTDALFAGCAGEPNLVTCIDQKIACEVCEVLDAVDGLRRNCDSFDDGTVNDSCSGEPAIGVHKCVLDPSSSNITIPNQALPLPPFSVSGAIDVTCGTIDTNLKASCTCELQFLDPINVIGIGFVCFTPGEPCPPGEIDCDGGNSLDVVMDSDHNIGTCMSSADCEAQCAAHCTGMGAAVFNEACEGFCEGGTRDTLPCTDDSDCPGGACGGKDGLSHGNVCQCECLTVGGAPSQPGGLHCKLPANINVEIASPCGDGDVLIALGTRCVPLTTETITSQMHNTNFTPGKDFPIPASTASGNSISCSALITSTTTGIVMVGSVNLFDSTIGDIQTNQVLTCQ
jgi:cysteine-rich repeat protein